MANYIETYVETPADRAGLPLFNACLSRQTGGLNTVLKKTLLKACHKIECIAAEGNREFSLFLQFSIDPIASNWGAHNLAPKQSHSKDHATL
jgi:hypothetical protein